MIFFSGMTDLFHWSSWRNFSIFYSWRMVLVQLLVVRQPFNTSSWKSLCEDTTVLSNRWSTTMYNNWVFYILCLHLNVTLSVTDSRFFNGSDQICYNRYLTSSTGPTLLQMTTFTLYSLNPTTQIGLPISTNNLSNSGMDYLKVII